MNERVSKEIESVNNILTQLNEIIDNSHLSIDTTLKAKQDIKLLKSWVKGVGKRLAKIPEKKHNY